MLSQFEKAKNANHAYLGLKNNYKTVSPCPLCEFKCLILLKVPVSLIFPLLATTLLNQANVNLLPLKCLQPSEPL